MGLKVPPLALPMVRAYGEPATDAAASAPLLASTTWPSVSPATSPSALNSLPLKFSVSP